MTTPPVPVTPRTEGDPRPDTLGMRLAHRAMLRDVRRLTDLLQQVAAGRTAVEAKRAAGIAGYVGDYCDSVHHHHSAEDDALWPVLAASAGPSVDLAELSDDHAALDPLLDRIRAGAAAFAARPADEDAVTALAVDLAELRDTLEEHIADEEASVLPAIEQHVSVGDWAAVEARIRKRAKLSFEVPRVVDVVTPEERATLVAEGGLAVRLMLALLVPPFRRRERRVFGG
ncbi:Hemerythrin-like domain-containing protein [Blastococcus sp. DSM 46786]|uniref:hemerythrin domain-containing protein n=1 Tax=Blastococcus sp. DSM 46786 TaxID=1798227 RepID=UPI0008C5A0F9|nr:hemerythrin domain-containing protein [Blastococcus sp. DSM 46786]SEL61514.1 Hemerythrin-like domain-containing protein [Blastococcus sp. DSM 46786]